MGCTRSDYMSLVRRFGPAFPYMELAGSQDEELKEEWEKQ